MTIKKSGSQARKNEKQIRIDLVLRDIQVNSFKAIFDSSFKQTDGNQYQSLVNAVCLTNDHVFRNVLRHNPKDVIRFLNDKKDRIIELMNNGIELMNEAEEAKKKKNQRKIQAIDEVIEYIQNY